MMSMSLRCENWKTYRKKESNGHTCFEVKNSEKGGQRAETPFWSEGDLHLKQGLYADISSAYVHQLKETRRMGKIMNGMS